MMSDEKILEETLEIVKEARKPGNFNLVDVIKDRAYPGREVTVYTNADAAFKLVELDEQMTRVGDSDLELFNKLESDAQALAEQLEASKLVFKMRGVGQGVIEEITDKANVLYKTPEEEDHDSEGWFRFYVTALVASNIVRVTDAEGNVDEHQFTVDEMLAIRNNLPADSWAVLVNTMQKLTLASGYFKGLTDAGFLPKS
jgi:hypothetical protein